MLRGRGQVARRSGLLLRNRSVLLDEVQDLPPVAFARRRILLRLLTTGRADSSSSVTKQQQENDDGEPVLKRLWRAPPKQSASWIPSAYRGLEAEPRRRKKWIPRISSNGSSGGGSPGREVFANIDNEKHEKEVRLVGLYKDIIVRLAPNYRQTLTGNRNEQAEPTFGSKLLSTGFSERMQQKIKETLRDIHRTDGGVIVDWTKFKETENAFLMVCRSIQHMCSTCTNLSRFYDENQEEYVDLAEFLLLELVRLGRERAKLAESARKATQAAVEKPPTAVIEEESKPAEEDTRDASIVKEESRQQEQGVMTGWFSSMVAYLPFSFYKKEEEKSSSVVPPVDKEAAAEMTKGEQLSKEPKNDEVITGRGQKEERIGGKKAPEISKEENTILVHEKPYLESTHRLFRLVVSSMTTAAKAVNPDETVEDEEEDEANSDSEDALDSVETQAWHEARRQAFEATARRMLNLLDRMPTGWDSPDPSALQMIMEMLSRAGTLESARMCNELFYRANTQVLKYSLVPEAYLEAVRFETDDGKRQDIVLEAIRVQHRLWKLRLPSHRVERIMHCSIILNCISVADMADFLGMCHAAEVLVKRAIGAKAYSQIMGELGAEKPDVDVQALPMLNYLTQIYASSGDSSKIDASKLMLKYMMHCDEDSGGNRMIPFPNVDTCNTVLRALSKRCESKSAQKPVDVKVDLDYATSLMDFMCGGREESACLPDETTFELMFRLLDAAKAEDAGDIAEDLLSKMEIVRMFSKDQASMITVSTYHRIMGYWLQTAKTRDSVDAGRSPCERALTLLDKMEVQSTPMFLSDRALNSIEMQKLYNVSLRPIRQTYELVLTICSESRQSREDKEKAFDVAADVYRRMRKQGFVAHDDMTSVLRKIYMTSVLRKICTFLPTKSEKRKKLEDSLRAEALENDDILKSA